MIDKNITINAVSPLKARAKSYKGGTKTKRAATLTAKRRGGFARSTATSNKPGYNVQTKFRIPDKKQFPSKPGGDGVPAPTKPYHFGPGGNIEFNPIINIANNPEFNNNPSFVNKNAIANAIGTGETETTTTSETTGHWEHWKKKKVRDDEGGARNACNEARRNSKYFNIKGKPPGLNKKGQTFEEECSGYNKHVDKHGHGKVEYESGKRWIPGGTTSKTTTKKKGGGNVIATATNL